jgi:protein FRG1
MSIDPEDDELVALKRKAGDAEIAIIRTSASREKDTTDDGPPEEKADLSQVEINYVYVKLKKNVFFFLLISVLVSSKKFQKFQDKKMKVSKGDKTELEQAKQQGTLHEALLDRRSKMKADRYCK